MWYTAPLGALVAGWFLPLQPGPLLLPLIDRALVPALAATVTVKIDLFIDFAFWPLLTLLLVSGDARWLGATVGAIVAGGRTWLRTMRLVMGSMACGPTQLAVAAVGVHVGALPPSIALALAVGAVMIEVTSPLRRSMALQLSEAEDEIERFKEE